MTDADVERRLREVGREFIEVHERAAVAIAEAAEAGMAPDAISRVSGLSSQTVSAFLQANRE
jgi:predicted transcriptional regulator